MTGSISSRKGPVILKDLMHLAFKFYMYYRYLLAQAMSHDDTFEYIKL